MDDRSVSLFLVDTNLNIKSTIDMKFKGLLILPLLVVSLQSASVDDLTFTLNDTGTEYSLTDCDTAASGSLVIPSTYNGKPVTSIGENTFKDCINLNSVTLPNGIASIEYRAFFNCTGLTNVNIPNTVTSIGDRSFYNCTSLTGITIPDSVTTIGDESFFNTGITSIVVPDSVTSIGYAAFRNCSSLNTVTQPDALTKLETFTYLNMEWLGIINIPSNLEYIGGSAILFPFEIPDSVNCYGAGNSGFSFFGDTNVIFSGGLGYRLSSSGVNAYIVELEGQPNFFGLTDTSTGTTLSGDIVIPQTIGGAFVKSVTFSGWLGGDNNSAPGITGITVSEGIVSIAESAFRGFEDLVYIDLPDSLTLIDWVAFKDCTSLTSITIPKNVSSIGGFVFSGASNLNEIIVHPDNAHYTSVDNSLYDKSLQTFVRCRADATDFTIPNTVTTIGYGAFEDCNITSVTIPDSVTLIRKSAFSGCTGLTRITIPDGVQKIEQNTFANCSALRQVVIPASVTTIEEGAFVGCSSLEMVIFKGSAPVEYGIGDDEYPGPEDIPMATGAKAYVMPQYLSTFGAKGDSWSGLTLSTQLLTYVLNTDGTEYSLTDCNESFAGEIQIPSTYNGLPVTSIGDSAFQDCTSITRITIPDSIASVESYAFRNCNSLGTITSEALTAPTLGSNAFENIPATKIAIPIGAKQSYLEAGDGTSYGGLAISYGSLIDGAISEARTEGQQDVITSPLSYGLYSPSYVISLLDSSRTAGQNDVTGDPSSYGLYSEQGITDLRAGSTILQFGPNNSATLELQIERSNDLSNWTANTDDLVEVQIPLNGDTEFYRFKITE